MLNGKLLKVGVGGGVILFLWGMLMWVVLPFNADHMLKFRDEGHVAKVIKDNASQSGIYVIPNMMQAKNEKEKHMGKEAMQRGPIVFASVCLEGCQEKVSGKVLADLILRIIAASIVAALLFQTKLTYKKRVGFVTAVGVLIAIVTGFSHMLWYAFPVAFSLLCMIEMIIGWFLAGLFMARYAK